MKTVNIEEAKTQLPRLLERAHAGEVITIAKNGRPYARLVPILGDSPARKSGTLRGRVEAPPRFFDPLPPDWAR